MNLSLGIVGLPNVGKSTLFATITQKKISQENYPFCTIDPNIGIVIVPDKRVDQLAELFDSVKKIYTTIEFVDIAGLIKGASKGEGLGNQFLANIREVDAIVYVLRCFKKANIINTLNKIDPLLEKEILETELILKDLETVNKRIPNLSKDAKTGQKEIVAELNILIKAQDFLQKGQTLFENEWSEEEKNVLRNYQFLTFKPSLYLLNGSVQEVDEQTLSVFDKNKWPYLIIDLSTEAEAVNLTDLEREELGLCKESELDLLIKASYKLLGLIAFLTTGKDETRAWALKKGSKAPQAGGTIHTDFEKNFIKAEVINWEKLIEAKSWTEAREKGWLRLEGKDYEIKDGDVIVIKHG
ncbi:MAG: redox-regulated ATPase YchF [Candidatus Pacebacteria bacterium]|nr:redox-regulated ATPase YchF [Candidatus Paceibacterota bacterium]